MEFYFEGLDRDGNWESGLVAADNDDMAKEVIRANNLEVMALREASQEEVTSGAYDMIFEPTADTVLDEEPLESEEESLMPLTEGDCVMEFNDHAVTGQLSFLMTADGQNLLFSTPAGDIYDVEERFWELPVDSIAMVEKRGLLKRRLEVTDKSGNVVTFKGDISKADLLIRFAMFEQ